LNLDGRISIHLLFDLTRTRMQTISPAVVAPGVFH
jgi:hypothetical protein